MVKTDSGNPTPAKSATAPPPSQQSENMVRALEQFITSVIGEQVTSMLDGADDILFEMANKAQDNNEQRLYLDTLRVIRHDKARLLRAFQDNLKQSFADGRLQRSAVNVDLDDIDSWSLRSADDIEETVAVGNLENKASSLYQQELHELENRLESLSQKSGETVSTKLVMPGRIFEAMRDSLKSVEVDFPVKRVIYRLAEQALLSNLKQVYVGANQMLAARVYEPRKGRSPGQKAGAAAERRPSARPGELPGPGGADPGPAGGFPDSAPQGSVAPAGAGGGPASPVEWPAGLSAQRLLAGLSSAAGVEFPQKAYNDAQLATEMASALNALSHGRPSDSWIPAPNLVLAGRLFDTLYQDRLLTDEARPVLHRLQYPVMKTALADPEFFRAPYHPVRQLVHDVFEMLASIAKPQADDIHKLSELIDNVLKDFEVDAERLGKTENRAPAVSDEDASKFLADQESRMAAHTSRSLEKVRRLVAMELQLRTSPRAVPDVVRPLLLSGFGPMLVHSMLNGGTEGLPWKSGMALLDRMLDSLDPSKSLSPAIRETSAAAIKLEISQRLLDLGMPNGKVQRLLAGLIDAYRLLASDQAVPLDTRSAEDRAKSASRQALTTILMPGSWFQVWDASHSQKRWLKLRTYAPAHETVLFEDFLGEKTLRIRSTALLHDLVAGRSAPVDPNPTVRRALTLLEPLAADLPMPEEMPLWSTLAPTA
jgi:hypothetical protein